jgi:hypothetical protein
MAVFVVVMVVFVVVMMVVGMVLVVMMVVMVVGMVLVRMVASVAVSKRRSLKPLGTLYTADEQVQTDGNHH